MSRIVAVLLFAIAFSAKAFSPNEVAVIVNEADPLSIQIGEYYAARRAVPADNVIRIRLPHTRAVLSAAHFKQILASVRDNTPVNVQVYALTWISPFRVECMSMTSAFTFGFAKRYCARGCRPTAPNPYFDSNSKQPKDDYGIRPTMVIAADNFTDAKALIDRGIEADHSKPSGAAHFVVTGDKARSTRTRLFEKAQESFGYRLRSLIHRTDGLRDTDNILFYFTGAKQVPYLDSLGFVPGAIADHLTSSGGRLTGGKQMSAIRWLQAGATGSYGTVVEPCNFPQKFPNPLVLISHYLNGDPLIAAYWKSVVWPGQGIFIGEPLSKPFAPVAKQTP